MYICTQITFIWLFPNQCSALWNYMLQLDLCGVFFFGSYFSLFIGLITLSRAVLYITYRKCFHVREIADFYFHLFIFPLSDDKVMEVYPNGSTWKRLITLFFAIAFIMLFQQFNWCRMYLMCTKESMEVCVCGKCARYFCNNMQTHTHAPPHTAHSIQFALTCGISFTLLVYLRDYKYTLIVLGFCARCCHIYVPCCRTM